MAPKNQKTKQTLALFIVTFLISLIVITYFIKSFSPNVDVEIGGEEEQIQSTESTDTESDVKKAIDDRLRWIQLEDNMPGAAKREDGQKTDEVTYQDSRVKTPEDTAQSGDNAGSSENTKKEMQPIEYNGAHHLNTLPPPVPAAPQAEPPKMSKVYVGSYPTIEQAIQAQNQLMNLSTTVSPFVKEVNGSYVLQAGSYANPSKAETVSREINSLGFHARVVKE